MGGISSILYTGLQALLSHQTAIQVVGQNIANVNTPGYTRERPVFTSLQTRSFGSREFHAGVTVNQIKRVYDQFAELQVQVATSNLQSSQTQSDLLSRIETLFNDLEQGEAGLSSILEDFFQAFQDLADHPEGMAERTVLLDRGKAVADTFHYLHQSLQDIRQDLNQTVQDTVEEVNRLVSRIAALNQQIPQVEGSGTSFANTLRDERDYLLKQLAEKLDITAFETETGNLVVLAGGTRPLIEGTETSRLLAVPDANDPTQLHLVLQDSQGGRMEISSRLQGGKLHGLLAVQETLLPDLVDRLDRLAARLTGAVNQVHRNGYGLDGSTGLPFFVPRQIRVQARAENTGGGYVDSATVVDPAQLPLDDYQIVFGSGQTFSIINKRTGETVSSGNTYTAGEAILFAGMSIVLNDDGTPPQEGDTFLIRTTPNAAQNVAVSPELSDAPEKIAAATTPLSGDNANALALAALRDTKLIDGETLGEFYTSLVSYIGSESQERVQVAEQQQLVLTQMENRREAISGVSLDEEEVDLIRFQQAFSAAANFISVADEMGQTILDMLR
ncbi:MAG: flagellar hook-associated protein FlgK [Nitrospinota bacterium]|nr:MAG: flagellar hook-associated protein FlgK [Nitrospinota bacterium]